MRSDVHTSFGAPFRRLLLAPLLFSAACSAGDAAPTAGHNLLLDDVIVDVFSELVVDFDGSASQRPLQIRPRRSALRRRSSSVSRRLARNSRLSSASAKRYLYVACTLNCR